MFHTQIRRQVAILARSFGVRAPIPTRKMRTAYRNKDYLSLIRHIMDSMALSLKIDVRFVHNSSKGPTNSTFYNTSSASAEVNSRESQCALTVQFSFLEQGSFEEIVSQLARELSSMALFENKTLTVPCNDDLCAMVLGFRKYFLKAAKRTVKIGGLSREEITYAARVIQRTEAYQTSLKAEQGTQDALANQEKVGADDELVGTPIQQKLAIPWLTRIINVPSHRRSRRELRETLTTPVNS